MTSTREAFSNLPLRKSSEFLLPSNHDRQRFCSEFLEQTQTNERGVRTSCQSMKYLEQTQTSPRAVLTQVATLEATWTLQPLQVKQMFPRISSKEAPTGSGSDLLVELHLLITFPLLLAPFLHQQSISSGSWFSLVSTSHNGWRPKRTLLGSSNEPSS